MNLKFESIRAILGDRIDHSLGKEISPLNLHLIHSVDQGHFHEVQDEFFCLTVQYLVVQMLKMKSDLELVQYLCR